jgi:hypothetical protein
MKTRISRFRGPVGVFALSMILAGCGGESTDTATTDAAPADAGNPAASGPAGAMPGAMPSASVPAGAAGSSPNPGANVAQAGAPAANSWDTVARQVPGFPSPAGGAQSPAMGQAAGAGPGAPGGAASGKPMGVKPGVAAPKYRQDPFESFVKFVVPEVPAFSLALPRRLAPPYVPPPPPVDEGDPNLIKGPLPPLSRRVAGVMYNGAITAILETGDANGAVQHDVIRPGSVIPFGLPGQPDLTVESITMKSLILRAQDGRSVEVKLSGLPPAVADALRSQFGNGGGGGTPGGGMGGMGMGGDGGGGGGGQAGPAK